MKKITAIAAGIALIGMSVGGTASASGQVTDVKDWNTGEGEQSVAMTLTPDRENGIEVYEVCSACHLLEGWGMKNGTFPQLAGQHKNVLIKQLADIRALNRDNPTMYPFALPESIGDEQAKNKIKKR